MKYKFLEVSHYGFPHGHWPLARFNNIGMNIDRIQNFKIRLLGGFESVFLDALASLDFALVSESVGRVLDLRHLSLDT